MDNSNTLPLMFLLIINLLPNPTVSITCTSRRKTDTMIPYPNIQDFTDPTAHIIAYGKVEHDYSQIECEWTINPILVSNQPVAYIDLYFEYVYLTGGSLHLSDGSGKEVSGVSLGLEYEQ